MLEVILSKASSLVYSYCLEVMLWSVISCQSGMMLHCYVVLPRVQFRWHYWWYIIADGPITSTMHHWWFRDMIVRS
jgi:hypothetical protein